MFTVLGKTVQIWVRPSLFRSTVLCIMVSVALAAALPSDLAPCRLKDVLAAAKAARAIKGEGQKSSFYRSDFEVLEGECYFTEFVEREPAGRVGSLAEVSIRRWSAAARNYVVVGNWKMPGRLWTVRLVSVAADSAEFCGTLEGEGQISKFVCWRGLFGRDEKEVLSHPLIGRRMESDLFVAVDSCGKGNGATVFYVDEDMTENPIVRFTLLAARLQGEGSEQEPRVIYRAGEGHSIQSFGMDAITIDGGFLVAWLGSENTTFISRDRISSDAWVYVQRLTKDLQPNGGPWRREVEGIISFPARARLTGQGGGTRQSAEVAVTVAGTPGDTHSWIVDAPEIRRLGRQIPSVRVDPLWLDVFEFPSGLLAGSGLKLPSMPRE